MRLRSADQGVRLSGTEGGYMSDTEQLELLSAIVENSDYGLYVVNSNGIITLVNKSFEELHGVRAQDVIGKHVTEVIKDTHMHIVARSGVADMSEFDLGDKKYGIVTRVPIFKNGKCVGAVGKIIFRDVAEVTRLAQRVQTLRKQVEFYKGRAQGPRDIRYGFDDIVSISARSQESKQKAMQVAATEATILLLGESGVGKEVYAHSIHQMSHRAFAPFVRVNCSAIQENLFESELFGYEEGAFTGAKKGGKQGKFELANNGTIFLDEIGDMPLEVQAKLLRVLQEQEIDKLGGEKQVHINVRVITATNQNLEDLVAKGKFRKDLFYRINVIPVYIPALRDRREDIPELVHRFWKQLQRKHGIYHKKLAPDVIDFLVQQDWPGNIRELHNVLERSLTIVLEEQITLDHIRLIVFGARDGNGGCITAGNITLDEAVKDAEQKAISFALARCSNNRLQAAKMLGISRPLLYKKLHEFHII